MLLKDLILESIEDKGILKAVFLGGTPGAGKTYVSHRITDGSIQPRIVNTDRGLEFLAGKGDIDLGSTDEQLKLVPRAEVLTKNFLFQYINSMLPLIVDGTSSKPSALLRRMGLLESFGYDIAMVWINTPVETSIRRIKQRERTVSDEYVRQSFKVAERNHDFYKDRFRGNMLTINNDDGELTDEIVNKAYKKVAGFFNAPVKNPVGQDIIEDMREKGAKYLSPETFSKEHIDRSISVWYRR